MERIIIYTASVLFFNHMKKDTLTNHFDAVVVNATGIDEFMERVKFHCQQKESYEEFLEFSIQASKIEVSILDGAVTTMEAGKLYWSRFSATSSARGSHHG